MSVACRLAVTWALAGVACSASPPQSLAIAPPASDGGPEDGAASEEPEAAGAATDGGAHGGSDGGAPADASARDAGRPEAGPPAALATTDGKLAAGFYCGKNVTLQSHVAAWNAPSLDNPDNLFHVGAQTEAVDIEGYCTGGCVTGATGHDHCTAPQGAPVAGKECFNGAGLYCGHTLGIAARSYPVVPGADQEGLFGCSGGTDVLLDSNCACEVSPGAADQCVAKPGRRLWIAYETGTTTCVPELTGFWDCMLTHSTFDSLVLSYGTGYALSWGGIAQIPASCGTDFGCAVSAAGFAAGPLDVVLIVDSGPAGGKNDWSPVVSVGGHSVPIHGAYIGDASGSCNMQTAYSMHEIFEATTDPGAADCCDGEIPAAPAGDTGCLAWNVSCAPACGRWGPSSCGGDGSYGLATLQCPSGAYTYQRVSPASDEYGFGGNQCLTITAQ